MLFVMKRTALLLLFTAGAFGSTKTVLPLRDVLRLLQSDAIPDEWNLGDLPFSGACIEGLEGFAANDELTQAYTEFIPAQMSCFADDMTSISTDLVTSLAPGATASNRGSLAPCAEGLDTFEPVCEQAGGYVCQNQMTTSVKITLPSTSPGLPGGVPGLPGGVPGLPGGVPGLPGGVPGLPGVPGSEDGEDEASEQTVIQFSFSFNLANCLPNTCTRDDFDLSASALQSGLDALNEMEGDDNAAIEISVELRTFCSGEDGFPQQFGAGVATETTITSSIAASTELALACASCTPAWSVEFTADPNGGTLTGGDVANIALVELYKNEDFAATGCLAAYKESDDSFGIFCPEGAAGDITLAQDGGDPQALTSFQGDQLTSEGEKTEFTTTVTRTAGASSTTPFSALSLLVFAVAALFEN